LSAGDGEDERLEKGGTHKKKKRDPKE